MRHSAPPRYGVFLATVVAFFLVEMGDKTQIATVALAAQFHSMVWVVIGTTLGMMLANVPVVFAGDALIKRVPLKTVRSSRPPVFAALGLYVLVSPRLSGSAADDLARQLRCQTLSKHRRPPRPVPRDPACIRSGHVPRRVCDPLRRSARHHRKRARGSGAAGPARRDRWPRRGPRPALQRRGARYSSPPTPMTPRRLGTQQRLERVRCRAMHGNSRRKTAGTPSREKVAVFRGVRG